MRKLLLCVSLLGLVAAAPATKQAASTKTTTTTAPVVSAKFVVHGKVTDDAGKPVADASITARCGANGNYITTGKTKTDKKGEYRLPFEPGVFYERGLGNEVAGFQDALITVSKGGYFEKNLGRQGDLAMTDDPPGTERREAELYAGIVRAGSPYSVDFVLAKSAKVDGALVDVEGKPVAGVYVYLTGADLPPAQTYLGITKTDAEGKFRFGTVPAGYSWLVMHRDKYYVQDVVSEPFKLEKGEAAKVQATYDKEKHTLVTERVDEK